MRRTRTLVTCTVVAVLAVGACVTAAQEVQAPSAPDKSGPERYGGEWARMTLGFEQIGAAGTPSDQRYSLALFVSRPLPGLGCRKSCSDDGLVFGPRARWWGDVRIDSYPQQVNSEAAGFATGFVTSAGAQPVNKLVQTAEFITGLEYRVAETSGARAGTEEGIRQRFALTTFFGVGAIGPFPPGDDPTVLEVPADTTSAQYTAFHALYPEVTSRYVAFAPSSPRRFSSLWSVGARLYTLHAKADEKSTPLSRPPGSVEISIGQNELVKASGWTWHASAFYPFALTDRSKPDAVVIYLFGDVTMGLGQTAASRLLFRLPAAVDAQGTAIPLTNPNVTIISTTRDNQRDTYRVGIAIDLLTVWKRLTASRQENGDAPRRRPAGGVTAGGAFGRSR